ncbi:MAG: hypothetical protein ABH804_00595 [archaeon]
MEEEIKKKIINALDELRKEKERKFNQTADLIINLQKFDVKKTPINLFVNIPYKIKEKSVAGFLESKNKNIDAITPEEFKKYSDKKELKKIVSKYDFFIAQGKLMPNVATTFGRALGPAGKMPSPQMGIILNADDKTIKELKEKINNMIKVRVKEASVKLAIGKQDMKNEEIVENVGVFYDALEKALPKGKDNIKNIEIKFTMTKPRKIQIR